MSRPRFVIVSGAPASGKSTLARPLSRALGMPLFEKDAIKERLANTFGEGEREYSRSLGLAAAYLLFDIATELIGAGQSVMVESYFHHGKAEQLLRPLISLADSVLVHCTAPRDVLVDRYLARRSSPGRHGIHEVVQTEDEIRAYQPDERTEPLDLPIPRLIVSTATAFPVAREIEVLVGRLLEGGEAGHSFEESWP